MALQLLADDHFALAPLIQARLEERLPGLPVQVCERADQVLAADQRPQVLMVMWAGYRVPGPGPGNLGASSVLYQTWLVAYAANNVSPVPNARTAQAGPVLARLFQALMGWVPPGAVKPFHLANAPMAPTLTDKKAVFPLAFQIQLPL